MPWALGLLNICRICRGFGPKPGLLLGLLSLLLFSLSRAIKVLFVFGKLLVNSNVRKCSKTTLESLESLECPNVQI